MDPIKVQCVMRGNIEFSRMAGLSGRQAFLAAAKKTKEMTGIDLSDIADGFDVNDKSGDCASPPYDRKPTDARILGFLARGSMSTAVLANRLKVGADVADAALSKMLDDGTVQANPSKRSYAGHSVVKWSLAAK